jgi:hypothetical protein
MKIKVLVKLFAGLGLLWIASAAQAQDGSPPAYDLDDAACPLDAKYISTGNVTGNTGGSDQCFGAFNKNDPGPSGDGLETGGQIFDFIAKSDMGAGTPTNSGTDIGLTVTFGDACTTTTGADDNGCWSFTGLPAGYGDFVIVIKAASEPGWAAYLFSTNNGSTSGTWQVAWGGGGKGCFASVNPAGTGECADISHLSIYAAKGGTTVAEPTTLGLLGIGLIGLGLARRRRVAD